MDSRRNSVPIGGLGSQIGPSRPIWDQYLMIVHIYEVKNWLSGLKTWIFWISKSTGAGRRSSQGRFSPSTNLLFGFPSL